MKIEKIRFPAFGSEVILEGEYAVPGYENPEFAGILCHPHPLYGGSMDNIIIVKLRDTLHELGIATLRFNFRGTGLSEGDHDKGHGEVFDLIGASRYLQDCGYLTTRQIIIGYSFGAAIAIKFLHDNTKPLCFIGIAVPTSFTEYFASEPVVSIPTLLISGDLDEISSLDDATRLVHFSSLKKLLVEGGNHLFTGAVPGENRSRISLITEKSGEFLKKQIASFPRDE